MPVRQAVPRPLVSPISAAGGAICLGAASRTPSAASQPAASRAPSVGEQRTPGAGPTLLTPERRSPPGYKVMRRTPSQGASSSASGDGNGRLSPPGDQGACKRSFSATTFASAGRSALGPRPRPVPLGLPLGPAARPAPMSALAASAMGRRAAKAVDGFLDFDLAPEKKAVEARPATPPAALLRAAILAPRFRLDTREVVRILKAFGGAQGGGGIDIEAFHEIMREIFDVAQVKKDTLQSAYDAAECKQGVDVNKFLAWYVQNMFTEVNALEASPKQRAGNARLEQLARKHQCQLSTVERAKRHFDRFDRDRSGDLDFEEFLSAIPDLLKGRTSDIGENRIRHYFSEADRDSNRLVDFPEFAAWYLKYFNPELLEVDDAKVGHAEALIASYRPCVQRRCLLERRRSI